jgi:hypothetical protein
MQDDNRFVLRVLDFDRDFDDTRDFRFGAIDECGRA